MVDVGKTQGYSANTSEQDSDGPNLAYSAGNNFTTQYSYPAQTDFGPSLEERNQSALPGASTSSVDVNVEMPPYDEMGQLDTLAQDLQNLLPPEDLMALPMSDSEFERQISLFALNTPDPIASTIYGRNNFSYDVWTSLLDLASNVAIELLETVDSFLDQGTSFDISNLKGLASLSASLRNLEAVQDRLGQSKTPAGQLISITSSIATTLVEGIAAALADPEAGRAHLDDIFEAFEPISGGMGQPTETFLRQSVRTLTNIEVLNFSIVKEIIDGARQSEKEPWAGLIDALMDPVGFFKTIPLADPFSGELYTIPEGEVSYFDDIADDNFEEHTFEDITWQQHSEQKTAPPENATNDDFSAEPTPRDADVVLTDSSPFVASPETINIASPENSDVVTPAPASEIGFEETSLFSIPEPADLANLEDLLDGVSDIYNDVIDRSSVDGTTAAEVDKVFLSSGTMVGFAAMLQELSDTTKNISIEDAAELPGVLASTLLDLEQGQFDLEHTGVTDTALYGASHVMAELLALAYHAGKIAERSQPIGSQLLQILQPQIADITEVFETVVDRQEANMPIGFELRSFLEDTLRSVSEISSVVSHMNQLSLSAPDRHVLEMPSRMELLRSQQQSEISQAE